MTKTVTSEMCDEVGTKCEDENRSCLLKVRIEVKTAPKATLFFYFFK